MYMSECAYMYVSTPRSCSAHGEQKKTLDPLELELDTC